MKSITTHPAAVRPVNLSNHHLHSKTLLMGAGIGAALVLALGAQQVAGSQRVHAFPRGPIRIEGIPTPQQMMRVIEGHAFTVPAGKVFVVTGMGSTSYPGGGPYGVDLRFDGQPVLRAEMIGVSSGAIAPAVPTVPPGMTAAAGTVVTVEDVPNYYDGIALGYLANQ